MSRLVVSSHPLFVVHILLKNIGAVMAGLVPAIHVFDLSVKFVDARHLGRA